MRGHGHFKQGKLFTTEQWGKRRRHCTATKHIVNSTEYNSRNKYQKRRESNGYSLKEFSACLIAAHCEVGKKSNKTVRIWCGNLAVSQNNKSCPQHEKYTNHYITQCIPQVVCIYRKEGGLMQVSQQSMSTAPFERALACGFTVKIGSFKANLESYRSRLWISPL